MATKSFLAEKRFFDDKNYPRGFGRSGDFTKVEAALLEAEGRAMKALYDGSRAPVTEEEEAFVAACKGEQQATSPQAKVWIKYIHRTTNRRIFTLFGTSKQSSDDGDEDTVTDIDIDDDMDDAVAND
jgi:uncharacterized protein YifE (UPF0438 family)